MVKVLGHLDHKDEIFAKDYTPPPVRKKKVSPKILMVTTRSFKNLALKPIHKQNKRVRLKTTRDAKSQIKEMRVKEKRDSFKLEIVIEKDKRVQHSQSRMKNITTSTMKSTSNIK
jgi:hypothetical protein